MESMNKNEIVDLITKSPENFKSAMAIINNEGKIKKTIIQKLFIDLKRIATNHEFGFVGDAENISQDCGAFRFQIPHWKYCDLKFEFDKKDLKEMRFGLCYKSENLKKSFSDEKCKELSKILAFNLPETDWWPASRYLGKYRNWYNETYQDVIEGKYQTYIEEQIFDVLKCSRGEDI